MGPTLDCCGAVIGAFSTEGEGGRSIERGSRSGERNEEIRWGVF